ncbi:glyoxalase [Actinotalea sp. M2MS4P-6]|uniref:VOC family protein n=1 Tax=Actinotalea sp. M2MS4P-6 TaxID=2983762 RepID=UPI0021E41284|nr:VOC family protein [Actinotalea sp. M2MS4P-6]MCV2393647.1 glyoxalase [Actinotalea sp. M2MS4P-6]
MLSYPRVPDAVAWLAAALGFVERVRIGEGHRAQLSVGDGAVIVTDTGGSRRQPDAERVTHTVMIRVADVVGLCAQALREGATLVMVPTEFPFGERQCTVQDPWGHRWTLSETIADVAPEDWGGQTIAPR